MLETSSPIVVTGATGYIASHIVEELLRRGYRVRGTVRQLDSPKNDHLKAMANADHLELVRLDLNDGDDQFAEAFAGCEYVIHTASPFSMNVQDPQRDLVNPAVNGTLNALKGASLVGAKKVILTSSAAAITDEPIRGKVFSEADWNTKSTLTRNPYYLSKATAEREAWAFVEALPEGKKMRLVVMNPAMVIGPAHSKLQGLNDSCSPLAGLLTKSAPALVELAWDFVDVRDVALAHVLALENPEANGRHLLCHPQGVLTMRETKVILEKKYPQYDYPRLSLDNFFGNLVTYAVSFFREGQVGQYIRTHVGAKFEFDVSKSQKELGLQYRDVEASLYDTIENVIDFGFIPDRRGKQEAPIPEPSKAEEGVTQEAAAKE